MFIPQPGIDQDSNGVDDWVTADIIRPAESSSATNKMPAIIDPSPYYTTLCRGNEGQCMADWNNDNVNDRWPLFYDNYFVPRGYAYVLGADERHGLHRPTAARCTAAPATSRARSRSSTGSTAA